MTIKTIRLSEKTHESLRQLGEKGETFDDIINKLIRFYTRGGRNL